MAYPWNKASLPYKSLNDGSSDYWTQSSSGTAEYYYTPTDLNVKPLHVEANDSDFTEGTVGSLAQGEWDWADNDSIGHDTVYVRLTDDTDPDTKSAGYVKCSDQYTVATVSASSILTVGSIRITNNDGTNDANIKLYYYDDTDTLLYPETMTLLSTDSPFRDSSVLQLWADYELRIQSDLEDVAIYLSGEENSTS